MTAYYNEIDPAAAHILRALIADGVLAPGDVDTRSIKEVMPHDLDGYTQCHFFAGGGLWSVAARLAGWPDTRPLWTGSCPCQPFSAAGKGRGTDDPRHLWPDFHRLIRACRPPVVVGEQVAGAAGYGWFDGVRADLAGEGYASRGVDIPACAIDAPHQRNRLYWIALVDAASERRGEGRAEHELWSGWTTPAGADASSVLDHRVGGRPGSAGEPLRAGWKPSDYANDEIALADRAGIGRQVSTAGRQPTVQGPLGGSNQDVHADANGGGRAGRAESPEWSQIGGAPAERHLLRNGSVWADAEWLVCHDDKARRTKPGLRLLVDGLPGRVDLWRVGGNAIVPAEAAEVLGALLETELAAA